MQRKSSRALVDVKGESPLARRVNSHEEILNVVLRWRGAALESGLQFPAGLVKCSIRRFGRSKRYLRHYFPLI